MPSVKVPYVPIDKESVLKVKEKVMNLESKDDERGETGENYEDSEEADEDVLDEIIHGRDSSGGISVLLKGMGMDKYLDTFEKENLSLDEFLNMTEKDLLDLGIRSLKDRRLMVSNMQDHKEPDKEYGAAENHGEDYQIAKNVQNQLMLIENYCAFIEWQLKGNKLKDHKISSTQSVLPFLKQFTEASIKQSELIKKLIFEENSSDCLVQMILKDSKQTLPEYLEGKLRRKRTKKKFCGTKTGKTFQFLGIMAVTVGFSSALILLARHLNKINYFN